MDRERVRALFQVEPGSDQGGIFSFLTEEEERVFSASASDDKENLLKNFFKRWPRFYERAALLISPILFTGLTSRAFAKRLPATGLVLNLGSGPTDLGSECVNVDVYPFPNVHVRALGERLPFRNDSFRAVICDQVLEHVASPAAVIREMDRVLKPGGVMYLGVPFVFPLHPSPKDYSRWSVEGIKSMLPAYEFVESGISIGPTSGLLTVLSDWCSLIFSFGLKPLRIGLRYGFMILFFPLKYLDLLFARYPGAETIAAAVYVIARKPNA